MILHYKYRDNSLVWHRHFLSLSKFVIYCVYSVIVAMVTLLFVYSHSVTPCSPPGWVILDRPTLPSDKTWPEWRCVRSVWCEECVVWGVCGVRSVWCEECVVWGVCGVRSVWCEECVVCGVSVVWGVLCNEDITLRFILYKQCNFKIKIACNYQNFLLIKFLIFVKWCLLILLLSLSVSVRCWWSSQVAV